MEAQSNSAPSRRRAWLAPLVGLVVLTAAASAVLIARRMPPSPPAPPEGALLGDGAPPVGRPAPDFSLPTFNGGTLALRSLRGKPVVLNFWASWCVPCREETPMLVRLHRAYASRGVQFVGIDAEDQNAAARRFMEQYHVDYTIVRSDDDRVIDAYAVPGLPTTIFIGADGVVVGKVVGGFAGPKGEQLLTARLERLLAGQPR